jgi:hypothetical protein
MKPLIINKKDTEKRRNDMIDTGDDLVECRAANDFILNKDQIKELERLCGKKYKGVIKVELQISLDRDCLYAVTGEDYNG